MLNLITMVGLIKFSKSCRNIEELSLNHCTQITEPCLLQVVTELPNIQHFHCIMFHELQQPLFSNEGFAQMVRPFTKTLCVSADHVFEEGFAQFIGRIRETGAKLESLALVREFNNLNPEIITKQAIPENLFIALFAELPHLKFIEIRNFAVTDDGLRFLLSHCTMLEKIIIHSFASDLSTEWLDAVTPNNSQLQHLELMGATSYNPCVSLIKQLAVSCRKLTTLKTDCFYEANELLAFSNCFPYLEKLGFDFNVGITPSFSLLIFAEFFCN